MIPVILEGRQTQTVKRKNKMIASFKSAMEKNEPRAGTQEKPMTSYSQEGPFS
jgi:hypothetical protein